MGTLLRAGARTAVFGARSAGAAAASSTARGGAGGSWTALSSAALVKRTGGELPASGAKRGMAWQNWFYWNKVGNPPFRPLYDAVDNMPPESDPEYPDILKNAFRYRDMRKWKLAKWELSVLALGAVGFLL